MKWTVPAFSRGQVDAAGKKLISDDSKVIWSDVLMINNWRASHSYPLHALTMNLRHRAGRVDNTALVAQRLKRLSSIAVKLRRNKNMKLSQMQDIGGCRAVLRRVGRVIALVRRYENSQELSTCVEKYDYIQAPKRDGYRGVHLVYKFQSESPEHAVFNNHRIEIQLRSRLQHAWATAVETVDTFTKQTLKVGGGTAAWYRFFALMSSEIAMRENNPLVPETPAAPDDLYAELQAAADDLQVAATLGGWSAAIERLPSEDIGDATVYLLRLDPDAGEMKVTGFRGWRDAKASDAYLAAESVDKGTHSQAVLVSVESIQALRSAYPNYFADTRAFIGALNYALKGPRQ